MKILKQLAVLLALCLVLSGCALRNGHETVRILCYGDSNTYGFDPQNSGARYAEDVLWTTRLQTLLGDSYTVINAGKNGRTTAYDVPGKSGRNGLASLPETLIDNAPVDIVVFMLGTNECATNVDIPLEGIGEGMIALIKETRSRCMDLQGYEPRILVIGPHAILADYAGTVYEDRLSAAAVERSAQIADLYAGIAAEYDCAYLRCPDEAEISPIDCLHFTPEGHRVLADAVYECISDMEEAHRQQGADLSK